MASQAASEPLPLELHMMVGRKGQGNAWTCDHNDQSCQIRLPEKSAALGKLSLRHIVVLDVPNPHYGLLEVANTATTTSFNELLEVFTAAYGDSFKAQNFALSKDNVKGFLFNYTDNNGQRLASFAYAPTEVIKNSSVFRSACFKDNSLPCNCGCNRSRHGPCVILILDGSSWDHRGRRASKESGLPCYSMIYKDDPMTKTRAFPESFLARVIAQQEISNKSASADLSTQLKEKERLTEELEALQKRIDSLKLENEELKTDAEIHELTMQSVRRNADNVEKGKKKRQEIIERLQAKIENLDAKK